jgi:hypothetical protein
MIEDKHVNVDALREEFLAKRVERRQAETLIREIEARGAIESSRRAQQGIDDWFRNRQHRSRVDAWQADKAASFAVESTHLGQEGQPNLQEPGPQRDINENKDGARELEEESSG